MKLLKNCGKNGIHNLSEVRVMFSICLLCLSLKASDIQFTVKEKQQIVRFEKLEPENVWHFYL